MSIEVSGVTREPKMTYADIKDRLTPFSGDRIINMLASSVSDMEGLRIATDNRLRALTTKDADEDGVIRGLGLPDDDPNVKRMIDVSDSVKETESKAIKALEKAVKDYPLYDWLTLQKGVGAKTFGRLIGVIGDPFYHYRDNRVRVFGELVSYCGLKSVPVTDEKTGEVVWQASRFRRGQKVSYSPEALKRLHVIEEGLLKAGIRSKKTEVLNEDGTPKLDEKGEKVILKEQYAISEYGQVYLDRRKVTATTHPIWDGEGVAPDKSYWTAGHQHSDALRYMGRKFLENMWKASRDIHLKELGLTAADFDAPRID